MLSASQYKIEAAILDDLSLIRTRTRDLQLSTEQFIAGE